MIPVLKKDWLKPGVHVSAIKKQEISWEVISGCKPFFLHTNRIFTQTNYLMESYKEPFLETEKGWWSDRMDEILMKRNIPDIGDLVTGKVLGRTHPDQITGFLNNVGLGIQFAAVGSKVYELAKERGIGREIPTDWFLETVHP
jgi:ornithine cyclodeaminase/alanine dehydrogenase-like protein (mu-crystallin family)